jgi:hypothetical protein
MRLVSTLNLLRGGNSQQAQYYNTPPPQARLIEHEHEDDFEAPGEGVFPWRTFPRDMIFNRFAVAIHFPVDPERNPAKVGGIRPRRHLP